MTTLLPWSYSSDGLTRAPLPLWQGRGTESCRELALEASVRSHLGTLALKTGNFSKKIGRLVKRENGFTKTTPWTENPEN